jgi:radical SAM protein with 4Fe4S-binding SPASM domain
MESLTYGAFSQSLHRQVLAARAPLNGTIEVTRRCPLVCVHCYNNLPMGDREAQLQELSTEEHYRLLDQMADAGCLWLLYTGGEIFARPDFLDIYTHAKRCGFIVTLFTNGMLINERVADYLAEWRPFSLEISLYGRTRDTYERLTGVAGSFDRCMRGIRLALERELPLKLKTVALNFNKDEVWEMAAFAEELGVEFRFDAMMNPRIDCSQSPLAVRLSPEECIQLDLQDPRRMQEWEMFTDRFKGPVHPAGSPEADQLYQCGGGINSFAIDPHGDMSICTLSHQDKYNVRTGSFREGWEHFLRHVRDDRKITRVTKCTECQLKAMCGMCPANGELENGDPESPVDFLCRVAHLRAHTMGVPVPAHGTCEYCEGGTGHQELMLAVERLKAGAAAAIGPGRLFLPMKAANDATGSSCGSGGCSSCGTHG